MTKSSNDSQLRMNLDLLDEARDQAEAKTEHINRGWLVTMIDE
jgi:hypothetical protein